MVYLSEKKIVFRILNTSNIFIQRSKQESEPFNVKLSSNILPTTTATYLQPPEFTIETKFTTASDVWSFGLCLYELMALGDTPKDLTNLSKPEHCPDTVFTLIKDCLQQGTRIQFQSVCH